MSTPQTRSHEFINALVTLWSANTVLTGLKCKVYDGPYVTDLSSRYRLFVGGTGMDSDEEMVAGELVSPHAANVARDETLHITCAAWFVDGQKDMARARGNALAVVNEAVGYLRSDPGLSLPNTYYGGMDSYNLRYAQTELGAAAVYTFVLRFTARIYS